MDLNAAPLRGFLRVAELGSFTRAAEDMNISQPALSASIKELERLLGFALFDRTSRRVSLTREGRAFLVNAKRVVIETDWLHMAAREIRSNELRIATEHHSVLIPERVSVTDGFLAAHPDTQMLITPWDHSQIYGALRHGDVDIGLALEPGQKTELSPIQSPLNTEFTSISLARKPVGFIAPVGHQLATVPSVSLEQLRGERVVTINRTLGAAMSSSLMRALEASGADIIRAPEGDMMSMMRFALKYDALAVDLGWIEPAPEMAGKLRRIEMPALGLESELVMLRLNAPGRPKAELFWGYGKQSTSVHSVGRDFGAN